MVNQLKVISTAALVTVATMLPQGTVAFAPSSHITKSHKAAFTTSRAAPKTPLFMSDDEEWSAPKSAMIGGAGVNNAGEPPFEIRGFSLGNVVILGGILVTVLSFAEYLNESGGDGLNVSGLGFVYGIPIFLAGAALKYAEIEPVPCFSTSAGGIAAESKATEIIQKIKQDVTRHRYGDEAHLDTTVKIGFGCTRKSLPPTSRIEGRSN